MWIEHLPNTSLDTTATPAHQAVIVSSCCLILMVISSCAVIIAVFSSNKNQLLLMLDSSQLHCNSLFQAWVKRMRYCLLSVGHQLWWMTWVVVATVKGRAVELQIVSLMRSDTKVSSFPDDGWPLLTWLCPVINVSHLPYILESNPHPFYSFRGLKNEMRIRIECGLDSRPRAGFWKNDGACVCAVRTIQLFIILFIILYNILKYL
jgi:hypothetical protein